MLAKLNITYSNDDLDPLIEKILPTLGNGVKFEYDTWACEKKRKNPTDKASAYTIYFANTPLQYKDLLKHYVVLSFSNNNNISGIISTVKRVKYFLRYIDNNKIPINSINKEVAINFRKTLAQTQYALSQKNRIWVAVNNFFKATKGLDSIPSTNYFAGKNPFPEENKRHDNKYVPKYIVKQMDKSFKNESLPLFIRVVYWICRSIPSRIGEVLGMKIDCIKPVTEDIWVIFIPTWKQSGGYNEPQIRRFYFRDKGHGNFIKQLIQEQQQVALSLQDRIDEEDKKNFLLTRKISRNVNGTFYELEDPTITMYDAVTRAFEKVIKTDKIMDKDGQLYNLTSHQLRHNGITDRLYNGFSLMQTSLITDHKGLAMIQTAYNHPQDDVMIAKQKSVQKSNSDSAVYFKGKILNMDEATERRLLQNIRTRRIKNLGICGDYTGCESFQCLSCDSFIPDVDDLPYYEEQVRIFEEKLKKVGDHKYLKENIEYNLQLYRAVIIKINIALQQEENNNETTSR